MKFLLSIALMLSLLSGAVQAYPEMQPQQEGTQKKGRNLDAVRLLPKAFAIEPVPFETADGHQVDFSQYKGKVVMVNMWATWCPACVRELPALEKLSQHFANDKFVVLPVSIDADGQKQVQPFLKSLGMENFKSFYDPKQHLGRIFPLDYIPATFILDKTGNLIAFSRSYVDWNDPRALDLINNLIKQNS